MFDMDTRAGRTSLVVTWATYVTAVVVGFIGTQVTFPWTAPWLWVAWIGGAVALGIAVTTAYIFINEAPKDGKPKPKTVVPDYMRY